LLVYLTSWTRLMRYVGESGRKSVEDRDGSCALPRLMRERLPTTKDSNDRAWECRRHEQQNRRHIPFVHNSLCDIDTRTFGCYHLHITQTTITACCSIWPPTIPRSMKRPTTRIVSLSHTYLSISHRQALRQNLYSKQRLDDVQARLRMV
jgi:hypothetical protein